MKKTIIALISVLAFSFSTVSLACDCQKNKQQSSSSSSSSQQDASSQSSTNSSNPKN